VKGRKGEVEKRRMGDIEMKSPPGRACPAKRGARGGFYKMQ